MIRRSVLVLFLICFILVAGASADPWWDTSWGKRVPLTITDASGTDGVQAFYNVTYDSDMQSDFGDLRFVQDDGATPVDYWIEEKSDDGYALCWLELPAGETTIYQYYKNTEAESESNGTAVFLSFFDASTIADIETAGAALTLSTASVGGETVLKLDRGTTAGNNAWAYQDVILPSAHIIESRQLDTITDNNVAAGIATALNPSVPSGYSVYNAGAASYWAFRCEANSGIWGFAEVYNIGKALPKNTWYRYQVHRTGSEYISTLYDDNSESLISHEWTDSTLGGSCAGIRIWRQHTYISWFRVRHYAATEPSVAAGVEEDRVSAPEVPFPGLTALPQDLDYNDLYEDINGNNRLDYNDLTTFFLNLAWARDNQPTEAFDFNSNGRLDYADVISLFQVIKNA